MVVDGPAVMPGGWHRGSAQPRKTDFDALMDSEARIALVIMRNLSRLLASYARQNAAAMTDARAGAPTTDPV